MDISQSNWSETDGSNNQASPDGAPFGMAPSGVNKTMRMMMGGIKRFWGRINGTVQVSNIGDAYTYTPPVAAPSLVNGEVYTFRCNAANTGAATLNVGVGGAKALVKSDGLTGAADLAANDLLPGIYYQCAWDSLSAHFVVMNTGVGAAVGSLSSDVNAAIRSTSAAIKLDIGSVSGVIKLDIGSVSSAITSAFGAADRSTSAAIKADLASVSSVITSAYGAADRSTSVVIKSDLGSVSAAITAAIRSTSAVIVRALFPVGSIYTNYDNATNPGTLLGFGTWAALAQGRVLGGAGVGVDDNGLTVTFAATFASGEYTHTLNTNEIPAHSHVLMGNNNVNAGAAGFRQGDTAGVTNDHSTENAGGGGAHNNIQPTLVVYMWRRTA